MIAKDTVYGVVFTTRTTESSTSISQLSPFQTFLWRKDHLESPPPCLSLEGSRARKLVPPLLSYLPGLTGENASVIIGQRLDAGLLSCGIQDQETCRQDQ
jgi:hypothetical protein